MWLTAAVALLATGTFSVLVQWPAWSENGDLAGVNAAVTVLFVLTGLWLRREPGQREVAWALMAVGLLRSLDFADAWSNSPVAVYDLIFGGADRVFGAWALLRYPNRALQKHQRIFLTLLVVWMFGLRTLITVTSLPQWDGEPASAWWPTLYADLSLNNLLYNVDNFGEALFGVAVLVLLARRLTLTTGLDRIVITPVIMAGLAAAVAAGASALTQAVTSLQTTPGGIYIVEGCLDITVPLAFLVSATQRTLLLRNITGLIAQISAGADIEVVRGALRGALDDPTLEIVDLSGHSGHIEAADPPGEAATWESADRIVEFIRTEGGSPIAVVLADPVLERYRSLFDAAVQTSGLALQNAQIQAQAAREKLDQVRASRSRLLEATDAERRRIERDLHDGVQQHVLGLAAQLTAAVHRTADPVAHEAFLEARDGLREVLAKLRDLAHGIHPAVLTQGGLRPALEDVAERLPLSVQLTIPATRLSPAVEATAYYVACEALANAVKHARANSVTVTVQIAGSELTMAIADDGVGGAQAPGRGLSNIVDRVGAFDGEMTVVSPAGAGTRLEVRIPCG
ncbi:MAG: histidine kinase [Trebonia sp.]|jgi:signal transduction histidine kinase